MKFVRFEEFSIFVIASLRFYLRRGNLYILDCRATLAMTVIVLIKFFSLIATRRQHQKYARQYHRESRVFCACHAFIGKPNAHCKRNNRVYKSIAAGH